MAQESRIRQLERPPALLGYSTRSFEEDYLVKEDILGQGRLGVIRVCVEKKTGNQFACKTIAKSALTTEDVRNAVRTEVGVMKLLKGHPNIVDFKSVHEDDTKVQIVMELCKGGDLNRLLSVTRRFSEKEAAWMLRKLLTALSFCHQRGLVHRDIKPQNILLKLRAGGVVEPKLADFGHAACLAPGSERAKGIAGSAHYVSPEAIQGKGFGPEADIWSLGVVLFQMLSGNLPFRERTTALTLASACLARPDYEREPWPSVSIPAKKLVFQMLSLDPALRPSPEEILCHPWVSRPSPFPSSSSLNSLVSPSSSTSSLLSPPPSPCPSPFASPSPSPSASCSSLNSLCSPAPPPLTLPPFPPPGPRNFFERLLGRFAAPTQQAGMGSKERVSIPSSQGRDEEVSSSNTQTSAPALAAVPESVTRMDTASEQALQRL
eukprot:TRINITY_DN8900_c0_g1_i1.p1 TRINITY_DN8900_c0_g1~~TRINITY_DN8900_c0_g1_i1.p1  ORF type:complete len:434 (+),score=78.64 TRINITY_DN8900_c0_g1_i1:244-1545(+)